MKSSTRIIVNVITWIVVFILGTLNLWWIIIIFPIFCYIDIYIHEFGHALAGLAVKFPIKRITIGSGRELIRKKIGSTIIEITNGFNDGHVRIGPVSGNFLRARFLLLSLGGVLAQGFAIATTMSLFSINLFDFPGIRALSVAHVFIYSNLILIAFNLFPKKVIISGVPFENDGLSLLRIPYRKNFNLQDINATVELLDTYELFKDKQFDEAEVGYKKSIEKYPELLIPKINLSAVYIKQARIEEAIAYLENLVKESAKDEYSILLYNNLAWAYLLRNENNDLQKADEYSMKTFEEKNKIPEIFNTRGCVLIEKGELGEGIKLLTKFVNIKRKVDENTNNPVGFIAMAYGYYLKNEIEKALEYIGKFESCDKTLDADEQLYLDHVISRTDNFNRGEKIFNE